MEQILTFFILEKSEVKELIQLMTKETKEALDKEEEGDNPKTKGGVDVALGDFVFKSTWLQRVEDLNLLNRKIKCFSPSLTTSFGLSTGLY